MPIWTDIVSEWRFVCAHVSLCVCVCVCVCVCACVFVCAAQTCNHGYTHVHACMSQHARTRIRSCTGVLYPLRLEYRRLDDSAAVHVPEAAASAHARLKWRSNSMQPAHVIPQHHLFYASAVARQPLHGAGGVGRASTVASATGSDTASYDIRVTAAAVKGACGSARGDGLTLATAGQAARFSIAAADAFGNPRAALRTGADVDATSEGIAHLPLDADVVIAARAEAPLASSSAVPTRPAHADVVEMQDGGVLVSMRPLVAAGRWADATCGEAVVPSKLYVDFLNVGGLSATYYGGHSVNNSGTSHEVIAATGRAQSAAADTTLRIPLVQPAQAEADILARHGGAFHLRWAGYVRAHEAGVYNFSVQVNGGSHAFDAVSSAAAAGYAGLGVRVWVDRALVVDQWDSDSAVAGTVTLEHALRVYPLQVELRDTQASQLNHSALRLTLFWASDDAATVSAACGAAAGERCAVPASSLWAGLSACVCLYCVVDVYGG